MGQSGILRSFLGGRVTVRVGDITRQNVDAIVNAANSSLLGGGGVDGAIHRVGGPAILEACRELRRVKWREGLPAGEAVATSAGELPCGAVVHTVGPIRHGNEEPDAATLAACYRNSLRVAAEGGARSVAFPAVATGVYGYPAEMAAPVVSRAIGEYLKGDARITEVRLIFHTAREANIFLENQVFGVE
jgi:O-acetyl-ADP-ribose deacetylase (regulator of RNase III)